ncbi:hypothetical protein LY78DRAFT_556704, partial [Colletotrichum sublineola]
TIVTPSGEQNAGSMNDALLPPPVPMICTTGLCPSTIACIACAWLPRNVAPGRPVICRSCPSR